MFKKSFVFLSVLAFLVVSCANNIIPDETLEKIAKGVTSSSDLKPPVINSISQGAVKQVKISWQSTNNATKYNIYSTDQNPPPETDSSLWERVGESTTTEATIQEYSGISKYYYITTVNIDEKESSPSEKVFGTTLATPQITSIEQDESGTQATVRWYMDNCSTRKSKYYENARFEVLALDSSDKDDVENDNFKKVLSASDFNPSSDDEIINYSYTFTNLTPKTTYYFFVKAYNINDTSKTENSSKVDAETARKMTPVAVNNFSVQRGRSVSGLNVSFNLPSLCEYQESSGVYGTRPLYFKIERKVKSDSSIYETIVDRLSSISESNDAKKIYHFTCDSTSATKNYEVKADSGDKYGVTVEASGSEEMNQNYPDYIPGYKVTFTDYTAVRGVQYEYRIQSYVDDTRKTISSADAISSDEGWLLSVPTFSIKSNYSYDEGDENIITNVAITFNLNFEDYADDFTALGESYPYTYKISQYFKQFSDASDLTLTKDAVQSDVLENGNETETSRKKDVTNKKIEFVPKNDITNDNQGYYEYELTIKYAATGEELYKNKSSENIVVLRDSSQMPDIENFEIQDGFANKFILSWKEIPNSQITISYKTSDDAEAVTVSEEEIEDISTVSGITTYKISAVSGEKRLFTLNVKSGISKKKEYSEYSQTLGTANPEIVSYDYDNIYVKWSEVQKADVKLDSDNNVTSGFTVEAKYQDESVYSENICESSTTEIKQESKDGVNYYTCKIKNPFGYNNYDISGLPIDLTVKAVSSQTEDNQTENKIEVKTVGPALLNTKVADQISESNVYEDTIAVQWNEVKGAEGYIIHRLTKDPYSTTQPDTYYYHVDSSADSGYSLDLISGETENIGTRCKVSSKVSSDKKIFTLSDVYAEPSEGNEGVEYQKNQSKIAWGIEYDYVIIPVKEGGDSSDFEFADENPLLLKDSSVVNYTKKTDSEGNITDEELAVKKGATYGYAKKIYAEKAQDGRKLNLKFEKPFYTKNYASVYKRKFVTDSELEKWNNNKEKYSNEISAYQKWTKVDTIDADTITAFDKLDSSLGFSPYEYIVKYNCKSDTIENVPDSLISLLKTIKETRYTYPTGVEVEPANKGYLQNINLTAKSLYKGEDNENIYTEQISWDKWDFSLAALGPSKYEFYIMNPDLSAEWTKIGEIGSSKDFDTITETLNETVIKRFSSFINLTPEGFVDKTKTNTNGLLKVLRNAKHYYKVVLTGDETPEVELGGDSEIGSTNEIYGYRQVTNEELAKAAMLVLSYAFYKNEGGGDDYSNVSTNTKYGEAGTVSSATGYSGAAIFESSERATCTFGTGKYQCYYTLNDYAPKQLTPSEKETVFLSVVQEKSVCSIAGDADRYVTGFYGKYMGTKDHTILFATHQDTVYADTNTMTVKGAISGMEDIYNATINFRASDRNSVTISITRNGKTETLVDTSDIDIRKKWFPMQIYESTKKYDSGYEIISQTYGWWPPYNN